MNLVLKHKGIEDFKRERQERYEMLDFPKWKRLKIKGLFLAGIMAFDGDYILSQPEEDYLFEYKDLNEFGAVLLDNHISLGKLLNVERSFGVDDKFNVLAEGFANAGVLYYGPKGHVRKTPLEIVYEMDDDNRTLIDHNIIVVDAGAKVEIVIHYKDKFEYTSEIVDDAYDCYHVGLTKIYAHGDSHVKLVKLQDYQDHVLHIDGNYGEIQQDGEIQFNTCDLGGHTVVTDYTAYMDGDGSRSASKTAYLGDGKRRLDLGFNLFHKGRYSDSLIETKGALLDESRKVFRGNLKFEKGAKRATGSETEYVLLLDKRVHSDAIPALLCDEDDVSGEHAASAGQINEGQLFYLMSRGFSKEAAMKLIIHGNFSDVIDDIPVEAYRTYIDDVLNRRLINDI